MTVAVGPGVVVVASGAVVRADMEPPGQG
jgi:hypothetical protein